MIWGAYFREGLFFLVGEGGGGGACYRNFAVYPAYEGFAQNCFRFSSQYLLTGCSTVHLRIHYCTIP